MLLLIFTVSCSGSGNLIPTTVNEVAGNDQVAMTGQNDANVGNQNHHLWAYNLFYYDAAKDTIEVIPDRFIATHWNVLSWLEQAPCSNCLQVTSFTNSDHGTKLIDVMIRHPFPSPNLTGFDVRGITLFNGNKVFIVAGLERPGGATGRLVNPDGHTTLYNSTTIGGGPNGLQGYLKGKFASATVPDADLNGFIRYFSDDPNNTRNAFYAGDEITMTFDIDMPDASFVFGYAVDASWTPALVKPVTDPMTDFGPEANCPEAWKVVVPQKIPIGGGVKPCGGGIKLVIDIYDWQGKDETHLPRVECNELFDGQVEAVWTEDGAGYTRYEAIVENTNFAPEGDYECLIIKEASENDPVGKPWLDLTAYQITSITVDPMVDEPPTANASADKNMTGIGQPVQFDASDSVDNDCDGQSIVKYEWQWLEGGPFEEGTQIIAHSWDSEGIFEVQLRVTDDESSTDLLDAPIEITVTDNQCPTAWASAIPNPQQVNLPIDFDGSDSIDPDGTIAYYEWDWENDGIFDELGMYAQHSWDSVGVFEVQLRVTDNDGCPDTLDSPLEVIITTEGNQCPTAVALFNPDPQYISLPVEFYAGESVDPDGVIVSYEWDWEADGLYDEEGEFTSHVWDAPGTYFVQLRVTDIDGCPDELDAPLEIHITTINNDCPTAIADVESGPKFAGLPVSFFDNGSYDPDGSVVSYEWDWENDGIYDDNGLFVEHVFPSSGIYYVQFRVVDDEGCPDELDQPLEVVIIDQGLNPIAISNPQGGSVLSVAGCEVPILFQDDGSYDPDGGLIVQYEWDWENDGIFDESGASVYHTFDSLGTFEVQMRVTDDEGANDTLDQPIIIIVEGQSPDPDDITPWSLNLRAMDIVYYDIYAFVLDRYEGLKVFDVQDPENPQFVSCYYSLSPETTSIAFAGWYILACEVDKVTIINFNNPNLPTFVMSVPLPAQGWDIVTQGSYAYVACQEDAWNSLEILDISIINLAYICKSVGTSPAYEVAVNNSYAYLAGTDNLEIVFISDPPNAYLANSIASTAYGGVFAIDVSSNAVFISDQNGIISFTDIFNPSLIHVADDVDIDGWAYGLSVSGSYLYVGTDNGGIHAIDISNPESMNLIYTLDTIRYAIALDSAGGYLYAGCLYYGLKVFDISTPGLIQPVGEYYGVSSGNGMTVYGNTAYILTYGKGLIMVDITDPSNATVLNSVEIIGAKEDVVSDGEYAYVANQNEGLTIFDVNPVESAHLVHTIDTDGAVTDLAMDNGYVYMIDSLMGDLYIVDVSTPESAAIINSVTFQGFYMSYSDGYAYTHGGDLFTIVDVDPPMSAYVAKQLNIPSTSSNPTFASGGYCYSASDNVGTYMLHIIDVSPAEDAYLAKTVPLSGGFYKSLAYQDGYVFAGHVIGGLDLIDVDPTDSAHFISNYNFNTQLVDMEIDCNTLYICTTEYGLRILSLW